MSGGAARMRLEGGRWHLQHGPIDLILGADGDPDAVERAHEAAWSRFQPLLQELVGELPSLRAEVGSRGPLTGAVARRMFAATWPHRSAFITPMAAVAGAVADEIIEAYRREPGVRRAYVNDGGDIALHLTTGTSYRVGLFADLERLARRGERFAALDGDFTLSWEQPVRGVATSGWRGRSFSLGIADSVTVLARDGAAADAAATMVANAVNLEDPRIARRPALELDDTTDLGERLVTVDVPPLDPGAVNAALDSGSARAQDLVRSGLIWGAVLGVQGRFRVVGGCTPVRLPEAAARAAAGRRHGESR